MLDLYELACVLAATWGVGVLFIVAAVAWNERGLL